MRILVALAFVAALAACGAIDGTESSPEDVAQARYAASGPKLITVMTMVNNRTGGGGHSALLINGSQQVIFDPAGSFRDPRVTERGDVIYGVSPTMIQAYKGAHARETFHVVSQEFVVTPAQAERALQLVMSNGSVPSAYCANATTALLAQVPGFEDIKQTFYPKKLMEQLATRPGVTTTRYIENDKGDVVDALPSRT